MVLATVANASHTSAGAVDVAAAALRFYQQGPLPTAADGEKVITAAISSTAPDGWRSWASVATAGPNYPQGVDAGQSFRVSMLGGMWHLEEAATDRVVVTVGGKYAVDGGLTANSYVTATYTLVWENEGWRIAGGDRSRPWDKLFPIGRTFTGDC